MGFSPVRATVLIMLVLGMGVLAGCGGSSSGTTGGSTSGSEESTSNSEGSTQPAAGFSKKAKPATFGEEASEEERDRASETLERNMSARAAGNYEVQCETLASFVIEQIEEGSGSAVTTGQNCAKTLEREAKGVPPGLLENNLVGPIAALRIKGNRAYALYHGTKGDYAMPMELENGEWKVAGTLTEPLPKN